MNRFRVSIFKLITCLYVIIPCHGQESPILKIGLVADPQYADQDPRGERHYRESIWKLSQAIDTFNREKVDFVQTLGDVIDDKRSSYDSIIPVYDRLNSDIPSFHVLGNHDFSIDLSEDSNVPDFFEMPSPYYSYRQKGWRFIVLDGTDYSFYANDFHQHDTIAINRYHQSIEGKANQKPWNGAIGKKQQEWLKSELSSAERLDEKVILFCHFPVYPFGHSENLWNDMQIVPVLENSPAVVAYFNGHNHAGAYGQKTRIHFVTLFGMVDTRVSSFAILEIYKDYLNLRGFGNQKSLNLYINE